MRVLVPTPVQALLLVLVLTKGLVMVVVVVLLLLLVLLPLTPAQLAHPDVVDRGACRHGSRDFAG